MSEVDESSSRRENMTLGTEGKPPLDGSEDGNAGNGKQSVDLPVSDVKRDALGDELLDHVANSKAIFKSQQKEEPELSFEEKRAIAGKLLERSHCLFLSKFGRYMRMEHLEYFGRSQEYETVYHVSRLRRYFNNSTRHIDVKNRRYEALKTLIEKGEYFSEREMMRRNPLLYEHLVGRYLTREEREARDNIDTKSASYVDVLMETIERNKLQNHLESQQREEDETREESDSDDSNDDDDDDSVESETKETEQKHYQWGEVVDVTKHKDRSREKKKKKEQGERLQNKVHKISNEEIKLFRQEFVTNMYQSFLDGKDRDFDYSTTDDNEAYDNVELRNQDEEEKYFDSEAPETVLPHNECNDQNESEDELDIYMRSLKEQTPTNPHSLDNQT
ncbi:PREDICTED: coiled-coil domain-containing protein 97 [Wasmannia auropunctata]|uniref:coiled-coil domain-containing protein 97 n=1 Tax=Wasmannia auropunctata TaxID=64793 RepID=UPI0005EF8F33|nr:PREDICTED: coiled-coil domain-containing protein 97 [Wasmannia auropunctata]